MKNKTIYLSFILLFFINLKNWSQSNYIYQEEFNSQGTWTKDNNSIRNLYVANNKYYFEHKKNENYREITTRTFYLNTAKDFEIETSITKISGIQDYGMSFLYDYKDSDNYAEFGITATGYYRVSESNAGTYKNIKSWEKSSLIKTGNYATNTLKIVKKDKRITYYINGSYVYGQDYKNKKGDRLAMRLYRNQKIAIDYFRVKYSGSTITKTTKNKSILFEGFNNNNNDWSIKNDANVSFNIEGGNYIFQHKRATGGWSTTINQYINSSKDFKIVGQFKKVDGILNNGFGLTFGKKDNNNQNHFLISSNGSFKIVEHKNGTRTQIKNWTKSSHIKQGINAYNHLEIRKEGTAYKFYINDKWVYTTYSIKMYGDYVGFTVYDDQTISIGYLSIAYINQKSTVTNNTYTTNTNNSYKIKETILFDGYTDNKNDWSTTKNDKIDLDIKNGNYYFEYKRTSGGWTSSISKYIDTSRDFMILADIKKESGILNNGYGITFGRLDSENQNLFFISGLGSFTVNKVKNNNNNYLKNWEKSSAIKAGNGKSNILKIVKIDKKVEYFINNTKVYTDYNPEFFGNRLGYIVYDNQKISVAYISVGYLDKKNTTNTNRNNKDNITNINYNDSDYFFSDQFTNNNNNWHIANEENINFNVKNGKYYLNHKRDNKGWSSYLDVNIDTYKDFEIETKIDKINGVTNYGYGLIFGKKDNNDFRFYISSTGYYKIARVIDNKEQIIQKWTLNSNVNSGNLKSNVLTVKKEDRFYKFYINGTYVYQTEFENFFGNKLGYVVYDNQEIAIDYLRVKYLTKNTITKKNIDLSVPLTEQFNNNYNAWTVDNKDTYSASINDGYFNIHRKKDGGSFIGKSININTQKDFIIETTISREKSGSTGLYGLTFGRKNSSNEFTFLLSTNGSYMFRKFDNDVYNKIIPFNSNNAIKTGIGEKNYLKIVKSGKLLRFYINDVYLNEAPFEEFFGNKFGFTAYHEQKIAIDYLKINYQSNDYNNPPVVVITEPDVEELKRGFKIVKTKRIQVKGKATDKDGIFEILVNGVDAQVFEDGSFVANVPLKIGSNDLEVKAVDLKQKSSIKRFTIKRKSPEIDVIKTDTNITTIDKLDIGFGKYYALLIGVSEYNDASNVPDLEGLPTKDAQDLRDVLVNKYNFESQNIVMLNNSPTENEILKEFVKLKKKVTAKDNVLIFYAGHGIYDEATETGSWLPSDADPEYGLNMISNSTIKDYIKGINSKHTLLISDACFSGSIFKTRSYKAAPKSITRKFELPSRKAITSGTLKTVPNKSVFLKYLIDRLKNNTEPYLTARRIFDRIEEPVMNNSKNVPQYGTIQEVGDEGGDFIFIKKN